MKDYTNTIIDEFILEAIFKYILAADDDKLIPISAIGNVVMKKIKRKYERILKNLLIYLSKYFNNIPSDEELAFEVVFVFSKIIENSDALCEFILENNLYKYVSDPIK